MLSTLAEIWGLAGPRVRLPPRVVQRTVPDAEWAEATVLRREPTLPSEPVRMATTRMEYDTGRARTELGYTSIPARTALTRAAQWFVANGFVKDARVERIRRLGKLDPEIDLRSDAARAQSQEGAGRK